MLFPKANAINNRFPSMVIAGSSNPNRNSFEKFEFIKRHRMDKSMRSQTRQFGTNLSNCSRDEAGNNGVTLLDKNVDPMDLSRQTKFCNRKSKRSQSLMEGKPQKNDDIHDGVVKHQTSRPLKKTRRLLEMEDGDRQVEDAFQSKHYMWGVFKPKEDKAVPVAESLTTATCYTQEVEKERCRLSNK
ncbi:hypothetical protein U9M48_034973 [Paspalum notatum var. saurae]|uniref:Uncharacterized protein n=1 Tax=Paspalum notatum var. saurae TaxID=547442 RepID=A0AAQ3X785_PASNO